LKKFFFALLICLNLVSCGFFDDTSGSAKKLNTTHSFIFIDKTASVNLSDPFVNSKYTAALNELVANNIRQTGDQIDVYYIHENTAKSRCLVLKSNTERPDPSGLNATDLEAAQSNYDLDLKREHARMLAAIQQKMQEKNQGASNTETNINASIPVLAKALELGDEVKAYYFSDMVESVKAGRDFHIKPPKNRAETTEWAKKDAEIYKEFNLSGIEVHWILPFLPTSTKKENNPEVGEYWKAFFTNLGVSDIEEA
jgi:hypothetical protein